ncbi:MAG TPA: GNAT family N-acetyltransferase [Gammaproteobacteria bacterium]|nr:GNAT family N-acetyltransferase [Gammaproteobacteria bacterium]
MRDVKLYSVNVRVHDSIDSIPASDWNCVAGSNPFLRHAFLAALEHSGCVRTQTGWQPQHLSHTDESGCLVGALPLYLKSHSYGEYVFDWAWAEAWQRAGLKYYPKLVSAVPFSPVSGPRLLLAQAAVKGNISEALISKARELAITHDASSIHCLFPSADEIQDWETQKFMLRKDCQFHWHNRNYQGFDDYLGALSAENRKKIKRERRRVTEAGITHRIYTGHQLNERLLDVLFRFYSATYAKRARPAYLNRAFFAEIAATMPDALRVIFAFLDAEPVACAICFRDAESLYGRHWGCEREFHSLHFETCYYQGIEYCIREGLKHFNPGTQGEHKLARGFEPTVTHSLHWIAEPTFRKAIGDFLQQETRMMDAYVREAAQHLPFRTKNRSCD